MRKSEIVGEGEKGGRNETERTRVNKTKAREKLGWELKGMVIGRMKKKESEGGKGNNAAEIRRNPRI